MANIILRDYQNQAVNAVITQLNKPYNFENPVVCMPTGTGKSFVIAEIVRQLLQQKPTFTILVLTHVKELIQQNYDKFKIICPDTSAGIFSAGLNKKQLNHNVVFASIQSIINIKDNLNNIDFIIIDEAHRVPNDNESQYKNLINFLYTKNADLRIIGLTATPFRTGSGSILNDGIFTKIVFDNTQGQDFLSLIQNGYIVNLEPRETPFKYDIKDVSMLGGDYNLQQLENAVNKQALTVKILDNALQLAEQRNKFIVFAAGVNHAKNICMYLNNRNVRTTYITNDLNNAERDRRIADFKAGKFKAIVNNNILTTGFDCPEIDCIIMMRPTLSPVLWVQMLGRGMRPSPNKTNCLVLDYTNNLATLGEINNLNDNDTNEFNFSENNFGDADEKDCQVCGAVNPIRARFCNNCGEPFNDNYNEYATENDFIFNKVLLSDEETKLNLIAKEYNKNGIDALNFKNVMKLLNCSGDPARKYIRLFCDTYNIDYTIQNGFNTEKVLQKIKNEYDKNGIDALNTKNVSKLLNCSDITARKYIRLFCEEYNIDYTIQNGFNTEKVLQQIKNEYDKYGIDALNTKNVMKLLNCSDLTALRYIRKFCKEYNIDCPIKTKTHPKFNKDEVLQQIKNEYDKYGIDALNTKNVMKLLNCSDLTALRYIRLFCDTYNIDCPIQTNQTFNKDEVLQQIKNEYDKNGIDALNTKNVSKLLNCAKSAAIKYIRLFCDTYNIDCPIQSYNKDEVLQKIKNEYDKNGIDALNSKNVMKLLNCDRGTALRYIRKFCKEYNIDCPIKTKTHQKFNKDEVLQKIKNEYDKNGIDALNTKNVKKLLNCDRGTALRYIRKFCKEYNIARLEKNKKSASQNLEILE